MQSVTLPIMTYCRLESYHNDIYPTDWCLYRWGGRGFITITDILALFLDDAIDTPIHLYVVLSYELFIKNKLYSTLILWTGKELLLSVL